jgi:5-hydroxyisourate hydrolase-like protein (transthyretin family)
VRLIPSFNIGHVTLVSALLAVLVVARVGTCSDVSAQPRLVSSQSKAQSSTGGGHSISVKVLDAETGKPVKGIWVPLSELDEKYKPKKVLNAKTNSQGIADFQLLEPLPERVEFSFGPDELASCSEVQFVTDQILKTGVVAQNRCEGSKPKPSASPAAGQLVIFGKRITLWQRMRREIP